jgi:hypothetical protein
MSNPANGSQIRLAYSQSYFRNHDSIDGQPAVFIPKSAAYTDKPNHSNALGKIIEETPSEKVTATAKINKQGTTSQREETRLSSLIILSREVATEKNDRQQSEQTIQNRFWER